MCLDEHEMSWKYGLPCDSHQCSFSRFFVYSKITINNNLQHPCKEKEMEIVAAAALITGWQADEKNKINVDITAMTLEASQLTNQPATQCAWFCNGRFCNATSTHKIFTCTISRWINKYIQIRCEISNQKYSSFCYSIWRYWCCCCCCFVMKWNHIGMWRKSQSVDARACSLIPFPLSKRMNKLPNKHSHGTIADASFYLAYLASIYPYIHTDIYIYLYPSNDILFIWPQINPLSI